MRRGHDICNRYGNGKYNEERQTEKTGKTKMSQLHKSGTDDLQNVRNIKTIKITKLQIFLMTIVNVEEGHYYCLLPHGSGSSNCGNKKIRKT